MDIINNFINLIHSCFCIKICDKTNNQKESKIVKNINSSENSLSSIHSNKSHSRLGLSHSSQSISSDNLSDDSLLGFIYK